MLKIIKGSEDQRVKKKPGYREGAAVSMEKMIKLV